MVLDLLNNILEGRAHCRLVLLEIQIIYYIRKSLNWFSQIFALFI